MSVFGRRSKRRPKDPVERYVVEWRPICVADYGAPQRRVRVIMVAIRADLAERWSWPEPTHCHEVLLLDQLDGFYWAEHGLPSHSPILAPFTRKRVRRGDPADAGGPMAHAARVARARSSRRDPGP